MGWRNIILQSRVPMHLRICVYTGVCYRIMTGQVNPRSLPLYTTPPSPLPFGAPHFRSKIKDIYIYFSLTDFPHAGMAATSYVYKTIAEIHS